MSGLPADGERVRIESRDLTKVQGWPANRTSIFEGIVVPTFSWLEGPHICITSNDIKIPVRSFKMEHVVKIVRADGSETLLPSVAPVKKEKDTSWMVTGSKGASYVVSRSGSRWHCSCVAGGFGRACKHVKEIQAKMANS
jgi:hypothetical protein